MTMLTWNDEAIENVGQLLDAMFAIDEPAEAERFMAEYRAVNDHADANVGYVLGYVEPPERRRQMYALFQATHPVFHGVP